MPLTDLERRILQEQRVPYQTRYAIETMEDPVRNAIYKMGNLVQLTKRAETETINLLKGSEIPHVSRGKILSRLTEQDYLAIAKEYDRQTTKDGKPATIGTWTDIITLYLKSAGLIHTKNTEI